MSWAWLFVALEAGRRGGRRWQMGDDAGQREGLVVSVGGERFERAKGVLAGVQNLQLERMPAVFVEDAGPGCLGWEGSHRAFRAVWARVVRMGRDVAVFEDDVAWRGDGRAGVMAFEAAWQHHRRHRRRRGGAPVVTMLEDIVGWQDKAGERWWGTGATIYSPEAAAALLRMSDALPNRCFPRKGVGHDILSAWGCDVGVLACWREKIFVQDRVNVKPYQHNADNSVVG